MKLEQQICSFEHAKRLKELGVKQDSYAWWTQDKTPTNSNQYEYGIPQEQMRWRVFPYQQSKLSTSSVYEEYSAFTVAELGQLLPKDIYDGRKSWIGSLDLFVGGEDWGVGYTHGEQDSGNVVSSYKGKEIYVEDATEADARAKMLIYLLENKLITL
jgi:hypothetical protein